MEIFTDRSENYSVAAGGESAEDGGGGFFAGADYVVEEIEALLRHAGKRFPFIGAVHADLIEAEGLEPYTAHNFGGTQAEIAFGRVDETGIGIDGM